MSERKDAPDEYRPSDHQAKQLIESRVESNLESNETIEEVHSGEGGAVEPKVAIGAVERQAIWILKTIGIWNLEFGIWNLEFGIWKRVRLGSSLAETLRVESQLENVAAAARESSCSFKDRRESDSEKKKKAAAVAAAWIGVRTRRKGWAPAPKQVGVRDRVNANWELESGGSAVEAKLDGDTITSWAQTITTYKRRRRRSDMGGKEGGRALRYVHSASKRSRTSSQLRRGRAASSDSGTGNSKAEEWESAESAIRYDDSQDQDETITNQDETITITNADGGDADADADACGSTSLVVRPRALTETMTIAREVARGAVKSNRMSLQEGIGIGVRLESIGAAAAWWALRYVHCAHGQASRVRDRVNAVRTNAPRREVHMHIFGNLKEFGFKWDELESGSGTSAVERKIAIEARNVHARFETVRDSRRRCGYVWVHVFPASIGRDNSGKADYLDPLGVL
ncbi:hypothetical protein C8R45DRAFT_940258 [Mycena sanguinolenta]|nr:hypothetical protein C8R45DRAFT_940258 [Mycena sanguinolenta]